MKLDTSLENTIQIDGGHVPRGVVNFGVQKMALSMWIECKMKLSRHAPAPLKTARQFLIDFYEENGIPPVKDEKGNPLDLRKVNKHVLLEIYEEVDEFMRRAI
jgi:hypothetical protein